MWRNGRIFRPMAPVEIIPIEKTAVLWQALKQDGALVKLSDPDSGDTWRAVVNDVRIHRGRTILILEEAALLRAVLTEHPGTRLLLTFTDRNHVPHTCEVVDHQLRDTQIGLMLPPVVTRHQRRKIFRLEAPSGAELELRMEKQSCRLLLLDVSIGGALGLLAAAQSDAVAGLLGENGRTIADAYLIFPNPTGRQRIRIAECAIRRQSIHRPSGKIQFAVEFNTLDGAEAQRLTELIYEYQRTYLRRRRLAR